MVPLVVAVYAHGFSPTVAPFLANASRFDTVTSFSAVEFTLSVSEEQQRGGLNSGNMEAFGVIAESERARQQHSGAAAASLNSSQEVQLSPRR